MNEGGDSVFSGNDTAENLEGTEFSDTIFGGGGNDLISGLGSADLIYGGEGDDVLFGGGGNDTLIGDAGADTLSGGAGIDTVDYADNGANGVVIDLSANNGQGSAQDAFGDFDTLVLTTIEVFRGTSAADTMIGDAAGGTNPFASADFFGEGGDDLLIGSGLGELLDGGAGNDSLSGLGGNDTLIGGEGADTIDGGEGVDTVSYVDAIVGVELDLAGVGAGGAAGDVLSNVEIILGSELNDLLSGIGVTLFGNGGADDLISVDGTSDLFGGDDGDALIVEGSNLVSLATFDGGADGDALAFDGTGTLDLSGAVILDIEALGFAPDASGTITITGNQARRFTEFFSLGDGAGVVEILLGSVSVLDLLPAQISGLAAAGSGFVIEGDGDGESIAGTSISDTINGNAGNDTIVGGAGADSLNGGDDFDTLSYATGAVGIAINLNTGLGTAGDAAGDVVAGFERVIGTAFADTVIIGAEGQTIEAAGGDDLIIAGDGADLLYGGAGNDQMSVAAPDVAADLGYFGGEGTQDTLSIVPDGASSLDLSDITIDGIEVLEISASMTAFDVTLSVAQLHALSEITNGSHTGFTRRFEVELDDTDFLDLSALTLTGFDEPGDGFVITTDDDPVTIIGSTVAETITSDEGDDHIIGSLGADALFAGDGLDVLDYSNSAAGVSVNLVIQTAAGAGAGSDAAGDQISGFEHVIGSTFADELIGANGTTLEGGGGADLVRVEAGTVQASGGDGADLFVVRGGAVQAGSSLDGGAGVDRLLVFDFFGSVQDFRDDNIENIEILAFQTDPVALGAQLTLDQASQLEAIEAAGNNARTVEVDLGDGGALNLSGVTITGLDQAGSGFFINGGGGDETFIGGSGADTVDTGAGNDLVDSGLGDDSVDGGEGEDTLSFASLTEASVTIGTAEFGVFLDLAAQGQAQNTGAGTDIFDGFEHVEGSDFSDRLTGDDGDNLLMGGGSGDLLEGGTGNDTLEGGAGFDVVEGGAGTDHLFGGTDADGTEADLAAYFSASGPLIFDFGSTLSEVEGGSSADVAEDVIGADIEGIAGAAGHSNTFLAESISGLTFFLGGAEADTFVGGSGVDQLIGLGGDDVLYGNDGDDALIGGVGDDDLNGGLGGDVFFFGLADGDDSIQDLELGLDTVFFTEGELSLGDLTITDTDAGGGAATDALISYEIDGLAASITIIDHDATTVTNEAQFIFT